MSDLIIRVDVPNKGVLELKYSMDAKRFLRYKGPLAQIIIPNLVGPEIKYTMPTEDFVLLFSQFFQRLPK